MLLDLSALHLFDGSIFDVGCLPGDAACILGASANIPRMGTGTVVALICVLGAALSAKSGVVLGRGAPWTSAGWWLTLLYFFAVAAKATFAPGLPAFAEYIVIVALTIAFIIAGIRDERQAEPWWWPDHRGMTRAEKRRTT